MQIFKSNSEMKSWSKKVHQEGKTIGFIPTMGYFHAGHLNLMRAAKQGNDSVVVSIYVNPTQFGPQEDFSKYPRDLPHDFMLAETENVDAVFVPDDEQMYPTGYATFVQVESYFDKLCGKSRPGHFRGVATIVAKLLNIVQPEVLYLGQKDAQQTIIIKKMVFDMNMNCAVVVVPTTREPDGLAMSSRNKYLTVPERNQAVVLYQSLQLSKSMINQGERNPETIITAMKNLIQQQPSAKIDYIAIVEPETLEDVQVIEKEVLVALAVFVGKTRLIDNMEIPVK